MLTAFPVPTYAVHTVHCDKPESVALSKWFFQTSEALGYPFYESKTCTTRSDHSSFWNQNIPAIIIAEDFFGGDGNNCYHKTCDTKEKINMEYYTKIVDTVANILANIKIESK